MRECNQEQHLERDADEEAHDAKGLYELYFAGDLALHSLSSVR